MRWWPFHGRARSPAAAPGSTSHKGGGRGGVTAGRRSFLLHIHSSVKKLGGGGQTARVSEQLLVTADGSAAQTFQMETLMKSLAHVLGPTAAVACVLYCVCVCVCECVWTDYQMSRHLFENTWNSQIWSVQRSSIQVWMNTNKYSINHWKDSMFSQSYSWTAQGFKSRGGTSPLQKRCSEYHCLFRHKWCSVQQMSYIPDGSETDKAVELQTRTGPSRVMKYGIIFRWNLRNTFRKRRHIPPQEKLTPSFTQRHCAALRGTCWFFFYGSCRCWVREKLAARVFT